MAMSIDDLSLLVEIVESGSFSLAAAHRRWSQPQVSQRVAALEDQLGVQLFARHRRGATPTPACLTFLPSAQQALGAIAAGKLAVQGAPALPQVTLACVPSLTSLVFGPLLLELADAPLEVRCTTDHSPVIMDRLLTGSAQLGFVLKCPAIAGIQLERLQVSPIVAVVRRGHPLTRRKQLKLADVANARLAPQFWGEGCDELIRMLRPHRRSDSAIHAIQPASAAIELALEHGFLTFMPEMAAARQLALGNLVKLTIADLPHWEWEAMVAWRSGKRPDAAKQRVIQAVRKIRGQV
ncbi:LysR family transcriptional regulator [Pseudoduganella sp. DS3]|uniref:LysR family transcriptional regulator n=1 Tax=Pseudoduganella guangdongensis TaxID=2692179 RepID=A0A6N9HDQ0_9BURK|nr:LysR family transcriptional regulator [Pseudoduganella guangdongensis]MYN01576.1 LysR family transcriptional regulator [Pseudoduganella guangdongensis]